MTNLIKRLEDIKTELFDAESRLLAAYGEKNSKDSFNGNQTRRIAQLRIHQSTISEAIRVLTTVESSVSTE